MNRRTLIIAAAAAAVIIAAFGLNWYITYKKPNTVQEGVILIYRDATYQAVEDSIKASGTIKNLKSLERAARKRDLASHFEPGRYVIEPGMSNQYIIRMIANGRSPSGAISRPSTGWPHSSAATSKPTPPHSPPP